MKWKCKNCFEWSTVEPCEECGAPRPPQPRKSDEEIRDEVLDRLRGSPRTRMRELANYCEKEYDELMTRLEEYIEGNEDYIHLGIDTPYEKINQMWDDYELITGKVVPTEKRDNPFSCAC